MPEIIPTKSEAKNVPPFPSKPAENTKKIANLLDDFEFS